MYLYTPAVFTAGLKDPLGNETLADVNQAPLPVGEPVRELIRFAGALVLHSVSEPFTPALGARISVTVTVAESAAHGEVPKTT